jgi:hypothetical protein
MPKTLSEMLLSCLCMILYHFKDLKIHMTQYAFFRLTNV